MAEVLRNNLSTYRRKTGLTQSEAAYVLRISRSRLASYENGYRRPDVEFLAGSSKLYRVPVWDLCPNQFDRSVPDRGRLRTVQCRISTQTKNTPQKPRRAHTLQWISGWLADPR